MGSSDVSQRPRLSDDPSIGADLPGGKWSTEYIMEAKNRAPLHVSLRGGDGCQQMGAGKGLHCSRNAMVLVRGGVWNGWNMCKAPLSSAPC